MNNAPDVLNLDLEIEDAKKSIALSDALERLQNNPDFKTVVQEAYFKEEASNVVLAKAVPHLRSDQHQKVFEQRIIGIGEFRQWLSEVVAQGNMARKALEEAEQMRDEIESGEEV